MTIDELIIESVETAGPSTTAEALAVQMANAGVGSVIIEEEMEPVGIVTDRDLAVRVDARDEHPSEITAADIMTEDPVTVNTNAGLLDVTNAMCYHSVRRLPVVDEDETVTGIITLDDVLVLLAAELSNLGGVIESESPPY